MMKYPWGRICIAAILFVFCSCTKQFVFLNYQDPACTLEYLSENAVTYYVSDEPVVKEFKKSYADRYGSGEKFAAEMADSLVIKSQRTFGRGKAKIGPSSIVSSLSPKSADTNPMAEFSAAMERDSSAASIIIKDIFISNRYQSNPGMMVSTGGGGMMMGGGGSTESCIVGFKIEIWDNRMKRKLLEAEIQGECGVAFFAYKTALAGAVSYALNHLMSYLKDGKTAF